MQAVLFVIVISDDALQDPGIEQTVQRRNSNAFKFYDQETYIGSEQTDPAEIP